MEVLEYYVVYDGYTNDLISKHATKRAAEKQLMKLIDEGKYEEVGLSSYSTWLKNDKIYYPKKYQEDVFGRMGDIFRPMAKGGTMNPFSVKEKKVGNTKRFVIENKSTGISFGRFKNRKDAEQYLDTHYLAQGGEITPAEYSEYRDIIESTASKVKKGFMSIGQGEAKLRKLKDFVKDKIKETNKGKSEKELNIIFNQACSKYQLDFDIIEDDYNSDDYDDYAEGGVTNTFDNIFLGNGFKKVRDFSGVRFFKKTSSSPSSPLSISFLASVDDKNRMVEIIEKEGNYGFGIGEQVIYRGYSIKDVIDVVNEKLAKGGMTTFQDKVNAISKRLEGTKVPKRLEKDYGKRYNKEEAIQAGRRIAGSIVAKNKYNNGGTVGDSPYTDAEIREALQNFFAVPIKIVTNDNAYFAVKSVPDYKDGEYYFDSNYSYKNEEVWHYDYDTFESQISYIRTPKEHINEDDSYQIEAYYPIKKGYELKGVDVLEDGDLDYFKR